MRTHVRNVFNFGSHIFFLGPGSLVPSTSDAECTLETIKDGTQKKMIDANQCFSFVHKPSHNKELLRI